MKLLIVSASAGAGHTKAGQALEAAVRERLARMREAARRAGRPHAAAQIVEAMTTTVA